MLGFLEIWAEIEGRRESRREICCWVFEQVENLGSKTKCKEEAKRRKIDCWWVLFSGSGRFGHKTTSANKKGGELLLGFWRKWKLGQNLRAERTKSGRSAFVGVLRKREISAETNKRRQTRRRKIVVFVGFFEEVTNANPKQGQR